MGIIIHILIEMINILQNLSEVLNTSQKRIRSKSYIFQHDDRHVSRFQMYKMTLAKGLVF